VAGWAVDSIPPAGGVTLFVTTALGFGQGSKVESDSHLCAAPLVQFSGPVAARW